jgi:hypothetical protein
MMNRQEEFNQRNYHIRVQGCLDQKWADWFEGFVISSRGGSLTLLSGAVVDQAALHGVLDKINGLGLPLLLLLDIECPCTSKNCSRHGNCRECAENCGANGKQPYCFRERTRWNKQVTKING